MSADLEARQAGDEVARGGAWMFVAGLGSRGLRWVQTWVLSTWLGPTAFGVYGFLATVVAVVTAVAPLGLDTALVVFGSRARGSGDEARWRGALQVALVLSTLTGLLAAGLVATAPRWWGGLAGLWGGALSPHPEVAWGLAAMAPAVVVLGTLLVVDGGLRAARDLRASGLWTELALSGLLAVGSTVAVALGAGLRGAVVAFVLAHVVALAGAARALWRHRPTAPAVTRQVGPILAFALPQALASSLFRITLWTDSLMLAALADYDDVGIYRVVAQLAMFGALPMMAVTAAFNPVIADLVHRHQEQALNAVLQTVTRWLLVVTGPGFLVLAVAPALPLVLYAPAYRAGAATLAVLVIGQAVHAALGPAVRVLPMAGWSALNLVNALAAAALNVVLNALWIPEHGALGAAAASSLTLTAWVAWRVAETRLLLQVWPLDARGLALAAWLAVLGVGGHFAARTLGLGLATTLAAVACALFWGGAWLLLRSHPEDREVAGRLLARLRRR